LAPVLVVEDDRDIRACVAEVLSAEGFRVLEAQNGRDGLTLLESERPAVVVLDLMMPVMSGWEFRLEQKCRPEVAGIPVIVMTAYSSTVDADRFLSKPFDVDELVEAVHQLAARGS